MKQFKFSEIQAQAILDMRLQKLAGLERKKIEGRAQRGADAHQRIAVDSRKQNKMRGIIKTDLAEVAEKFGDDRRTRRL